MAQMHLDRGAATLASLERIPELDVEYGLAQAHHNIEMYVRMLDVFTRVHGQDAARLAAALAADDAALVRKVAHALKGAAAMIGIKGVSQAAASLHAACLQGLAHEELRLCCEILDTSLSSFVTGFRRATAG